MTCGGGGRTNHRLNVNNRNRGKCPGGRAGKMLLSVVFNEL